MIKSWVHKGLKKYFETGSTAGINPKHKDKIARQLDRLNASTSPQDMNLPGWRLHELTGNEKGVWSITVNGNWRITFKFDGKDAIVVDYRDYH